MEIIKEELEELINKYNNKEVGLKDIAIKYECSEKTIAKKMNDIGYKYNKASRLFEKVSDEEGTPTIKKPVKKKIEMKNRTEKLTVEIESQVYHDLHLYKMNKKMYEGVKIIINDFVSEAIRLHLKNTK